MGRIHWSQAEYIIYEFKALLRTSFDLARVGTCSTCVSQADFFFSSATLSEVGEILACDCDRFGDADRGLDSKTSFVCLPFCCLDLIKAASPLKLVA